MERIFLKGLFGHEFKDSLVKKVEADSAIFKAVNIVNKSSNNPTNPGRVQGLPHSAVAWCLAVLL